MGEIDGGIAVVLHLLREAMTLQEGFGKQVEISA